MKRFAIIAALALVATACSGGANDAADSAPTGEPVSSATVASTDKLTFEPKRLVLESGGTITWTNKGAVPHTVTFAGFDKPLAAGDVVEFTFTSAGTTQVRCTLHLRMTGEIVVV
ncbi:MAG TPA: plastocyanin/azurin family copper-binding protein [Actinomycetota bacterium]